MKIGLAVFLLLAVHASMACAASAKLSDGFDGSGFAPEGGLYYKENFEQGAGKVEFQSEVVRSGAGALKLSVAPLCAPNDSACSERAEIWERPNLRVPYNEGVWYGFAVKFGDPVPTDDHRYLIAQWKREIDPGTDGDFSPFLALRLFNGKLFATVETNYFGGARPNGGKACLPGETPVWPRPETNQMRALVAAERGWTSDDGSLFTACTTEIQVTGRTGTLPGPADGWIDFAIYTRPSPDGSGQIEIFANGAWIVTVKGRIGHADRGLGKNQYFKFGPYRAGHSTEWILYYDDFRRSPDCGDVLKAAICPF